jgi:hypothetical protein
VNPSFRSFALNVSTRIWPLMRGNARATFRLNEKEAALARAPWR